MISEILWGGFVGTSGANEIGKEETLRVNGCEETDERRIDARSTERAAAVTSGGASSLL